MRYTLVLVGILFLGVVAYSAEPSFTTAQRDWWAFKPVVKAAVPEVKNRQWVKTPIDAFVLAALEAKGLAPNPAADRVTLLHRASIDITGLPPTAEELTQFLNDTSPTAWARVVDRLLASPHYGERWGRHWLDVARYADSNGFKADETRPHIWRFRDYVIQAFNSDKPYDRFVREQIAGDELYPGDPEALVAMGFNRHWIDETNAAGLLTRRQETLDDMTNVTGATFLGLTYGCARCHDHKTDPILHIDYYRLQAFFAKVGELDDRQWPRALDVRQVLGRDGLLHVADGRRGSCFQDRVYSMAPAATMTTSVLRVSNADFTRAKVIGSLRVQRTPG